MPIGMYNKLYFMHTPKTGGRYIINSVLDPIREQLIENNVEVLNSGKFDHSNWYSRIDDKTYIVSILRDPASHIISLYTHERAPKEGNGLETDIDFEPLKDRFYKKIKNNLNYQNFQAKAFMRNELDTFGTNAPTVNIDEELLEKRTTRVNLLLNSNNLGTDGTEIQEKIFLDLGINCVPTGSIPNPMFYNPYSELFYSKFSTSEKDALRAYSDIDNKLYNHSNYYKI